MLLTLLLHMLPLYSTYTVADSSPSPSPQLLLLYEEWLFLRASPSPQPLFYEDLEKKPTRAYTMTIWERAIRRIEKERERLKLQDKLRSAAQALDRIGYWDMLTLGITAIPTPRPSPTPKTGYTDLGPLALHFGDVLSSQFFHSPPPTPSPPPLSGGAWGSRAEELAPNN